MLDYPGLGRKLHFVQTLRGGTPTYPMGVTGDFEGSTSDMILVREVAMMIVMDRLTDKPEWYRKVFDEGIVARWTAEALALPVERLYTQIAAEDLLAQDRRIAKAPGTILDQGCMEYCIKELRDKARFFESTGLIPTLDACAAAVKSDCLVPRPLHKSLRSAFVQLMQDSKESPDFHPDTNDMVHDLVHPSLYPLVYGRTRVFRDEVVGVADAIDKWSGKGSVIPRPTDRMGYFYPDPSFWSENYQWLPANVKFVEGGGVRFTSYINNLHPVKYRGIYSTIEKLIETVLPAWDLCLGKQRIDETCRGRHGSRFPMVKDASDDNPVNWNPPAPPKSVSRKRRRLARESAGRDYLSDGDYSEESIYWMRTRQVAHPPAPPYEPVEYTVPPRATLRSLFSKKGLQIIVKMATVELTPEKPSFPAGGWHVEGQMNEYIVGTAIYYLDSENITPSSLSFRMQTDPYQDERQALVGQGGYTWLGGVFGAKLGGTGSPCLQKYGSVETKEGKLLAFPNVFQHRVSGFELADKSKPGHRRIIVLWLVDPQTRIVSTANVPPQQRDWWFESAFRNAGSESSVPPEIAQIISERSGGEELPDALKGSRNIRLTAEMMAMVREELGDDWVPMSLEEAREHRKELIQERSGFQSTAEKSWNDAEYSFCEH